ncbi:G-protein coupled receptor 143 isoform X1 [Orussus abietinus]|uniref:G-protein coupled receptor 143 isoform X1 n=1 Tax=Orussus abietinus TaxID=222816 RepID=UPI000C7160D5|nr:G-protein coupled receptor 143 isoform X1 [Orussus abietinus]XP_023289864.1 G-protein coupled receptor 143 isoform X1 [Orussus abietinus]
MADPTIQTFCCHHNRNNTDMAVVIMQEFNTDVYNSVCMLSSTMGILGAVYQVLPREESKSLHRWQGFSSSRGREIIVWLAIADFFASLGVFVRSALWMSYKNIMPMEDDTSSVVFCALSSAWTQYFYMATWIWTMCYAIDMKLLLGEREGHPSCYHALAWICPAILTTFGLTILYLPDANCHNSLSLSSALLRILPNYCITYVLLAVVMIANPALYIASTRDLKTAVTCSMAQMTGRERKLVQAIRLKFALTNLVYYICWVPNIVNGILLWTLWFQLPIKVIISVWYIMVSSLILEIVKRLLLKLNKIFRSHQHQNISFDILQQIFDRRLLQILFKHSSMLWYIKDGDEERNFDWNAAKASPN